MDSSQRILGPTMGRPKQRTPGLSIMKAAQLPGPYCLKSLVIYMCTDIKIYSNSGSPKLSHNFIFSEATNIIYRIYCADIWSRLPIPIVLLAAPSFLTAI